MWKRTEHGMKNKTLVLILILLSIVASGLGTALQKSFSSAQITGFIFGAAFLAGAILAGARRHS
ncbi:hypothetical protein ACTID9_24795 [Brevibacillus fluminis]|uniref:hypothetical protein n=1 Tax=Brevibacillus fluminis TaxID=511487 RepID=UPI003F8A8B9E